MAVYPTHGSLEWDGPLQSYLSAYVNQYGLLSLSVAASAGATSITVRGAPGIISANAGHYIIIDPFTTEAELRHVTGVSGNTLTVPALTYAHSSQDPVYFVASLTQGNLIPWSWWGGRPSGDSTDATNNVTAFNRLTNQIYTYGPAWGIHLDPGAFCVNDQLKPEKSQVVRGVSSLASGIQAVSGFSFDTTDTKWIIHPYRDGSPVLFEQAGPSGRWWFRDFYVDGNHLTDANGVISSPQQPDSTDNLRIINCPRYGLSLNDVQYHDIRNLQVDRCGTSLHGWSCGYVRVFNSNFTSPLGTIGVSLEGVTDSSFYGALFETLPSGGKLISATDGSSRLHFDSIYTSGFSGGSTGDIFYFDSADNPTGKCTYVITNARCSQDATTINFVNDVQRGITFNTASHTQRALPFMVAHNDFAMAMLANGPRYYSGTSSFSGPEYGVAGPRDLAGSGTPEGVISAPVGSTYRRTNGGAGTSFYVKESGTGNTGWVAK
jgi:hypothetical protein